MIFYCIMCGAIKPKKETNKTTEAHIRYGTVPDGFSPVFTGISITFGGKITRRGFLPYDIQVFHANSLLVASC